MSTIQVDRIIPYQSSSVTIEGDVTVLGAATTGSNTFTGDQNIQGTITASIAEGFALVGGVGNISTLVATSSFGTALDTSSLATTGSNTFNGDQTINGLSSQTFNAPTNGNQSDILTPNGVNIDGQAYTNVVFGMQDYPAFGDQYKDAWVFDYYDSLSYNYGSEFIINPKRIGGTLTLSGSAVGISQLRDVGGNKTFLNQYANLISIGAFAPQTTDSIIIGHDALPFLRLSSLNNEITGSTIISGSSGLQVTGSVGISSVLQLQSQDPLPAGAEGQLANSGSNLYFFSASAWNQIAFV